jgi:3-methyladenine DNA glycosylase/8-oxoguanine DNA glycosylase
MDPGARAADRPSFETEAAFAPLDFRKSFALQALGLYDPSARLQEGAFEKLIATPEGTGRIVARRTRTGIAIAATGAAIPMAERWATHLPPRDAHTEFTPHDAFLRTFHREGRGLRLLRMPWIFDVACGAVLQQRVTFRDAMRGFRLLAQKHGEPIGERATFPSPAKLSRLPTWVFPSLGIDPRRGAALRALAHEEASRDFLQNADHASLRKRLIAIPGIGPWTTEMILGFGAGDPDALPLGDLHLPHLVAQAFGRGRWGSDELMVELLEPYRGHRFRVVRLIMGSMRRG